MYAIGGSQNEPRRDDLDVGIPDGDGKAVEQHFRGAVDGFMTDVVAGGLVVDLESCAREPIHIIGHIQSNGMLFALSEPDFVVRQVSANVGALLGLSVDDVLENSFEAVLGPSQFARFRSGLDARVQNPLRVVVGSGKRQMNCVAHRHDGVLVAEFELVEGAHTLPPSQFEENIEILLTRMDQASDILGYAMVAASEIQRLSGFHRVMIYRFDTEWNGEVIAEAGHVTEPDTMPTWPTHVSYLGMHFPATDIPAQARRMFLTNAVRMIADIGSTPVPIVPEIGPLTGRALDLTHAFLRSSSAVHLEYLRNIGVTSTLTVSIVVDERLWGLVACHHHASRPVDCSIRSVCELIARSLALQVALREATADRASRLMSRTLLDDFVRRADASDDALDAAFLCRARLLELLDADGLILGLGGIVSSQGVTVPETSLQPVIEQLRTLSAFGIASSNELTKLDESARSYASEASGALLIEFSKRSGDYLLFLRRELVASVNWAGNPDKAASVDAAGTLHPRTSFAQWKEIVRGRSRPWTELQLESARLLRAELLHIRDAARLLEFEARAGSSRP